MGEIRNALPNYYSEIRPRIEEISEEIAILRTEKRFNADKKEETAIDDYPKVIEELQFFYKTINAALPSLIEIREKNKKENKRMARKEVITKWILPILTLISGIVIGIIGMM